MKQTSRITRILAATCAALGFCLSPSCGGGGGGGGGVINPGPADTRFIVGPAVNGDLPVAATRLQDATGTVRGVDVGTGDLIVLRFRVPTPTPGVNTTFAFGPPNTREVCDSDQPVCTPINLGAAWHGGVWSPSTGTFAPGSPTPPSGSITMQAGSVTSSGGSTFFTIRISVRNVSDFFGAAFHVTFSPPTSVIYDSVDSSASFLR